jgi:hypothetical protein
MLLVLIIAALFGDLFWGRNPWILSSFGSDLIPNYLTNREFGFFQLRQGHIPFWNPYVYSGSPFFIDMQNQLFYPLSVFFLFLDTRLAFNIVFVTHVLLAGIFAYLWFARRLSHPAACLLGAGVFMLGGAFFPQISLGHLSNLCTMTWIPLIFLATEGWKEHRSRGWLALGVAAVSCQILAGHAQYVFYTFLAVAAYALLLLPGMKGKLQFILGLLGFYLVAACLTAFQLFPSLMTLPETLRGHGLPPDAAAPFSLPPENILTLFLPSVFGGPQGYFGQGEYGETILFMGITAFCLALTGLCMAPKENRIPFLLAFLAFLVALGPQTFLFRWLFDLFPFTQGFRAAYRLGIFIPFFLGMSAASGLDGLLKGESLPRPWTLLPAILGCVGLGWVMVFPSPFTPSLLRFGFLSLLFTAILWGAGKAGRARVPILLLLVLLGTGELFLFARENRPVFDFRQFEARQAALRSLANTIPPETRVNTPFGDSVGPPNLGIWGFNNMVLYRYARFIGASQGLPAYNPTAHPISRDVPVLGILRYGFRVEDSFTGLQVIPTHLRELKRAQCVDAFEVKPGEKEMLDGLMDKRFDPSKKVLLEETPLPLPLSSTHPGKVEIRDLSTDEVEIWAEVDHPSILLMSDSYSKGWTVQPLEKNGQDKYQLLPADLTLKAIPLAAGRHHLLMRYTPPLIHLGIWISLVSLALFCLFFGRITRYPQKHPG